MTLAIQYSDTINIGGLITILIAASALTAAVLTTPKRTENTNLRRQLDEARDEIHDKGRRLGELGAEKDQLQQQAAEAEGRAHALAERLDSMPDWPAVKSFTIELLEHVDEKAADRQSQIISQFSLFEADHERRAQERHDQQMELMRELCKMAKERA